MLQPLLPLSPTGTCRLEEHILLSQPRLGICQRRLELDHLAPPLFHAGIWTRYCAQLVASITAITNPIVDELAINKRAQSETRRVSECYEGGPREEHGRAESIRVGYERTCDKINFPSSPLFGQKKVADADIEQADVPGSSDPSGQSQ